MRVIVVSPHLDDAVLSCAAEVARCDALVTVFAGVPAAGSPLAGWDRLTGAVDSAQRVRERQDEDVRAVGTLSDGRAVHLDFLDYQYREGEPAPAEAIVAALLTEFTGAVEVFVPAAIGRHPDHVSARDAALDAAGRLGLPVTLYADVPYSIPYGWCCAVSGSADDPFVDRDGLLAAEFAESGLDPDRWQLHARPLAEPLRQAKLAALSCYRSQLPALDQGPARIVTREEALAFEARWTAR